MKVASPVFRRACSEPPGQLANLPNILWGRQFNLRHFATCDVFMGLVLARPMFFRYDVSYTPDVRNQMALDSTSQCLHGVPGQFVVLAAWINTLYEEFGSSVDPQYVFHIEREIRDVTILSSSSDDPTFSVLRLVVLECWRQVMYVYLYMVSVVF